MMKTWNESAKETVEEILSYAPYESGTDGFEEAVKVMRNRHDIIVETLENPDSTETDWIKMWRRLGGVSMYRLYEDSGVEAPEIIDILISKQRDYGPENIAKFGRYGLAIRTHDKVARLENLIATGNSPSNESILDTLIDIVGYSSIGIMWEKDEFLLPLAK